VRRRAQPARSGESLIPLSPSASNASGDLPGAAALPAVDRGPTLTEVLTVAEAAALLRVNVKTIYAEIAAGRIRVVRMRRTVRIPRAVITALLTGK